MYPINVSEEIWQVIHLLLSPLDAYCIPTKESESTTVKPSFLSKYLQLHDSEGDKYPVDLEDVKGAAGAMYAGGVETVSVAFVGVNSVSLTDFILPQTSSFLSSFAYAMILHPSAQKQAQLEIDTVIGSERLPEFEDRSSLPYVEALCWEVLR
jgi:hypothetical protein